MKLYNLDVKFGSASLSEELNVAIGRYKDDYRGYTLDELYSLWLRSAHPDKSTVLEVIRTEMRK